MKLFCRRLQPCSHCQFRVRRMPREAPAAESRERSAFGRRWKSARWTGPMLASNAETLPQGHFYTEPYFFDVISGGEHHPGSSGFYQYGLFDGLTVGLQPNFATWHRQGRIAGCELGDFKLLSQLRLTHFTPEHRIPTIAVVLQEVLPTGKYDRLGPSGGRPRLRLLRDRGRGQRAALFPAQKWPAAPRPVQFPQTLSARRRRR